MFTKFVRVALCELVQRPFRCYSVDDLKISSVLILQKL